MVDSTMGRIKDGWIYAHDYIGAEDSEYPEWVDYERKGRTDRVSADLYDDKLGYRWFEVRIDYRVRLSDGKLEIISTSLDDYDRVSDEG